MKVIIISGPTASGKTGLAIDLALRFGGEIVNFDSLLLYQEINIGTAKPTTEERNSIKHHMIDLRSVAHPMNAADYAREALPIVEKLLKDKKNVFLVGGSGFYLQALLKGMYQSSTTSENIVKKSNDLYQTNGIQPFLQILETHDRLSLELYHTNDHYRIRRAVEHWWTTGTPLSLARKVKDEFNDQLQSPSVHGWDILHIYLNIPKVEHLKIIENRTDRMLKEGLIDEVKQLLDLGYSDQSKPLLSIGYKESIDYLQGKYKDIKECRERIIISTRQLAKSQRTWFNREKNKETFNPLEEKLDIFSRVGKFITDQE